MFSGCKNLALALLLACGTIVGAVAHEGHDHGDAIALPQHYEPRFEARTDAVEVTGILKGGWHCGGNPSTAGTAADCPQCQTCNGVQCVPLPDQIACDGPPPTSACLVTRCVGGACQLTPAPGGTSCETGNPCTEGRCEDGFCLETALPDGTSCDDDIECTENDTCEAGTCRGERVCCETEP